MDARLRAVTDLTDLVVSDFYRTVLQDEFESRLKATFQFERSFTDNSFANAIARRVNIHLPKGVKTTLFSYYIPKSVTQVGNDSEKAKWLEERANAIQVELAEIQKNSKTSRSCHAVIDGGRDSKGSPNVVAGEGTGIVHSAPGCGDIDHKIGVAEGLPVIAPLSEDGTFIPGFGDFSGREAIAPETAELVFEKLKEKHLLVYVETYPHIYPHCWRTGDELVFRLVDEWFINMDWREEIKDVTRQIEWLPPAINGQERECDWLSLMGDWMISKKRFWGLALPIWVNENDPTDFEVIGSLAELKERAVEGWDDFEGNTPHRPWIDGVVIESSKNPGQKMRRIEDVGNPWLDAGIVPFSTMHYNHDHDEWQKWYPADLVTECFPGQFRNWFYSLLSLSTMMRYDETDDPKEKRPFKTLLGHRLVQNEQGKPMHKSDGTAIWFEEAAEQLGVDTMRWMYLAQNPAVDLRFGTRHPDEPVTLETPDGPQTETKEGVTCCKVTSTPADETRRRVLIPLWNSYAFFVNYARLDDFDPSAVAASLRDADPVSERQGYIPVADRPEIDRWILSNLHALLKVAADEMPKFNVAAFCRAAEDFLDDLTNWYIRRNRRRFWRSKDASDTDKTAAYQTLYEVLVTLCQALAPCIPFLTERMYQNLVGAAGSAATESVHLCDYPTPDDNLLDPTLNARTATAQLVVRLGHKLREEKNLRVRLPLSELQFACSSPEQREAIEHLADVIREELNIKQITSADHLDELVHYSYKPNLKTLGPKYGKLLGAIRNELPNLDPQLLAPLRSGQNVTVTIGGEQIELGPDDVMVSTEQASDWSCADESGIQIAISTVITPELEREGMARDAIRLIQSYRKYREYEEKAMIDVRIDVEIDDEANKIDASARITEILGQYESEIGVETRSASIENSLSHFPGADTLAGRIGDIPVTVTGRLSGN
ncbi:class I tRNA ligase family protein [bacterium]|nr:class I tRNA ligase family protein [bacterium]